MIGDAQAVLTGHSPGETIMAAAKYGNGKIFVTAHDCYVTKWFDEPENEKLFLFMHNVKRWLTNGTDDSPVENSVVGDLRKIIKDKLPLESFRIIK